MNIDNGITLDLLDKSGAPALSSTSDMPVIETKPDAQNEGAPPAAPDTPAEAEESSDKTISESATEPESTSASDEPRRAKGVQKRLDELVRQREEAERREQAERAEKLRLLALLEERGKPDTPVKPELEEPVKPVRSDFDDPDAYDAALVAFAADNARYVAQETIKAERDAAREQAAREAQEQASEASRKVYETRVESFKAKTPDFDEIASRPDVQVSIQMAAAIIDSEVGPAMQYYLGANPQEAQRIMSLTPERQLREMGKLEAKLSQPPTPVSAAPRPIKPVTPSAETREVDPETEPTDSYIARRRKETGLPDPMRRH